MAEKVHIFAHGISSKINILAWLVFEHIYYHMHRPVFLSQSYEDSSGYVEQSALRLNFDQRSDKFQREIVEVVWPG